MGVGEITAEGPGRRGGGEGSDLERNQSMSEVQGLSSSGGEGVFENWFTG